MGSPSEAALDGINQVERYDDGTLVRVFVLGTTEDAYPSGWAYRLHDGTTEPDPPRILEDGTIRRYDNSHEKTKGHELHTAPDPARNRSSFRGWSSCGIGSGERFRRRSSRVTDRHGGVPHD